MHTHASPSTSTSTSRPPATFRWGCFSFCFTRITCVRLVWHPAILIYANRGFQNTYPRLLSLIAEFEATGTAIRPFWLTPARDRLNASGLLGEVDAWATASEQLYVLCLTAVAPVLYAVSMPGSFCSTLPLPLFFLAPRLLSLSPLSRPFIFPARNTAKVWVHILVGLKGS